VRARYPNAVLFAMETFKQRYVGETRAAVTARNAAGDPNVRFINTEGWLTIGADYTDTDGQRRRPPQNSRPPNSHNRSLNRHRPLAIHPRGRPMLAGHAFG
jgi:hypothetical protein